MDLPTSHIMHLSLLLLFASQTAAFWILGCGKPVAIERIDPIVSPGAVSDHVHSIMGGNAFDWTLDFDKTQTSTCTTCGVSKDLSNYWVPAVYFHAENGSYISVEQVGGVNVYYQQRIDHEEIAKGKKIQPFPPGLRMLAGDPNMRTYDNTSNAQRAIEFACIPGAGMKGNATTGGFPNYTCPGGLQIRARFPSCWDGKNADSADHRSHLAYPSLMDNGACDEEHPVRIMALLYEVTFAVDRFDHLRKPGDQPFVLSNGDPTGHGWHADFLNGWDEELLRAAISDDTCGDSAFGDINKCKPFQPYLLSADEQKACPMVPSKVKEKVDGVLSALAGRLPDDDDTARTVVVSIPAPTASANAARGRRLGRSWFR
ncbi:hypothetical protein GE09DRAFT_313649 [Coniochaeta sp. 2T2.1]|nr:hypothetical protein GE09DRAFT_313649 [Coniochaeta sp. 2T2.1]